MDKSELNALMNELQNGNNVAFEVLYNKTHKYIFSFIYSYVQNFHTAEDLLQETYLKIKNKCQSYVLNSNVVAWFLQIAKNTCIDHLRKKDNLDEVNEEICKDNNDYFEEMAIHDLINKNLENIDRQIVLLHIEFGYKNREISKILDIPIGTVLWRYNKAIKILKDKLKGD